MKENTQLTKQSSGLPSRPLNCSTARDEEQTPFQRGYEAGLVGNGMPRRFPKPDDDWATRLYFRGWEKGNAERNK